MLQVVESSPLGMGMHPFPAIRVALSFNLSTCADSLTLDEPSLQHVELVSQAQPQRLPLFWLGGGPPLSSSLQEAINRFGREASRRWQPLGATPR